MPTDITTAIFKVDDGGYCGIDHWRVEGLVNMYLTEYEADIFLTIDEVRTLMKHLIDIVDNVEKE